MLAELYEFEFPTALSAALPIRFWRKSTNDKRDREKNLLAPDETTTAHIRDEVVYK